MKNKTVAAWLAFVGGAFGLHRFYLYGVRDWLGWLLPIPSLLGLYGIVRANALGLDDPWSWVLVPLLGITVASCALVAIVYGLMSREKWNARFNAHAGEDHIAGGTNWSTIFAIVLSLMIGTGVLMATLAWGFYNYFNWQVEEGRRISQ
ncbi:MAG TPA: NINE protein [Ramlibacter sp.]|nr:NINE protein [Ramlibacter sp.]